MKTDDMLMNALQDAREAKENALYRIIGLKNEQAVCAAQWNDTMAESFEKSINIAEDEYQKSCMLVQYYESEIKKRR